MKYVPFILITALALLGVGGFVVDESGQIETRQTAVMIAQDAARAGTNALTGTAVNGDAFQLSGPAATAAADRYVTAANSGATGTTTTDGGLLTVTVHMTYHTRFANLVGIPTLDATGIAQARLTDQQ